MNIRSLFLRCCVGVAALVLHQCGSPLLAVPPPSQSLTIDLSSGAVTPTTPAPNFSALKIGGVAPVLVSAVTNVASETAKLALTGQAIGKRVAVNFGGHGYALYRFEGPAGGESTAANWSLQSEISAVKATPDTTTCVSNTTLTNDSELQIDWVPVGTYECQVRIPLNNAGGGGFKWKLLAGGTAAGSGLATYVWADSTAQSGNTLGNLFTGDDRALSVQDYGFFACGTITVTAGGSLTLQIAQHASSSDITEIYAGAAIRLIKLK